MSFLQACEYAMFSINTSRDKSQRIRDLRRRYDRCVTVYSIEPEEFGNGFGVDHYEARDCYVVGEHELYKAFVGLSEKEAAEIKKMLHSYDPQTSLLYMFQGMGECHYFIA